MFCSLICKLGVWMCCKNPPRNPFGYCGYGGAFSIARGRVGWFPAGVSRMNRFVRYWLPALLWMAVIFYASTDAGHPRNTSRYLGPIFHWLFPRWPEDWIAEAIYLVRKFAHAQEYMILCLLLWRAFRSREAGGGMGWNGGTAGRAWGLATFYAATDEFHQLFVAGREGSIRDVAIDSFGASLGILFIYLIGRWRRRW